jgi:hypothetical protein
VFQPSDSEGVWSRDNGDGTLTLSVAVPTFRPANVARALGRMFLFTVDQKEPGFERVLSWVKGSVDWFPIPLFTLNFPGPSYDGVSLFIHRYVKSSDRSIVRVTLLYFSTLTAIVIPLDKWSIPDGLEVLQYPSEVEQALFENTSINWIVDNEAVKDGVWTAELVYDQHKILE